MNPRKNKSTLLMISFIQLGTWLLVFLTGIIVILVKEISFSHGLEFFIPVMGLSFITILSSLMSCRN